MREGLALDSELLLALDSERLALDSEILALDSDALRARGAQRFARLRRRLALDSEVLALDSVFSFVFSAGDSEALRRTVRRRSHASFI